MLVSVSDIHVRSRDDERYDSLLRLLKSKSFCEAAQVVFLGDVFHLMIGPHKEYMEEFPEFFEFIKDKCRSGGQVYFVEGNHDFHLEGIFEKLLDKTEKENFFYVRRDFELEFEGKRVLISHGDFFQKDHFFYRFYQGILRSGILKTLARIVPYKAIQSIGEYWSKKSMAANAKYYRDDDLEEKVRKRYRIWVKRRIEESPSPWDIVILGHSHAYDQISLDDTDYLNNGFFPHSNQYVIVDDGARLVSIEEPSPQ